jgi:hypothetical protein
MWAMQEKSNMKCKLLFIIKPSRNEKRDSDTESDLFGEHSNDKNLLSNTDHEDLVDLRKKC